MLRYLDFRIIPFLKILGVLGLPTNVASIEKKNRKEKKRKILNINTCMYKMTKISFEIKKFYKKLIFKYQPWPRCFGDIFIEKIH